MRLKFLSSPCRRCWRSPSGLRLRRRRQLLDHHGEEAAEGRNGRKLSKGQFISQGDAICGEVNTAVGSVSESAAEPSSQTTQIANLYIGMVQSLQRLGQPSEIDGYSEFMGAAEQLAMTENEVKAASEAGKPRPGRRSLPGSGPGGRRIPVRRRRSTASKTAPKARTPRPRPPNRAAAPKKSPPKNPAASKSLPEEDWPRKKNSSPKKKSPRKKKWPPKRAAPAATIEEVAPEEVAPKPASESGQRIGPG